MNHKPQTLFKKQQQKKIIVKITDLIEDTNQKNAKKSHWYTLMLKKCFHGFFK